MARSLVLNQVFRRELDPEKYFRAIFLVQKMVDKNLMDFLIRNGTIHPISAPGKTRYINELDILKIMIIEDMVSEGISKSKCLILMDNNSNKVKDIVHQYMNEPDTGITIDLGRIKIFMPGAKIRYQNMLTEIRGTEHVNIPIGATNKLVSNLVRW